MASFSLIPDEIGCMVQLVGATRIPVVHTVELLDWATGGLRPRALAGHA